MSNTSLINHGKGKVVKDKAPYSEEIDIFTPESLSMVSGKVASWKGMGGMKGYITATWLDSSAANRATPPDVKAGEEVRVFSYAETGKFYWKTERRNSDLRGHETVMSVFKNSAGSKSLSGGKTGDALKDEKSTSSGMGSFIKQSQDQQEGVQSLSPTPGSSKSSRGKSVGGSGGGGGNSFIESNVQGRRKSTEDAVTKLIEDSTDTSVVFAVDDLNNDGITTLIEALKYDDQNSIQRGSWDSPLSQSWLRDPIITVSDSTVLKYGTEIPFDAGDNTPPTPKPVVPQTPVTDTVNTEVEDAISSVNDDLTPVVVDNNLPPPVVAVNNNSGSFNRSSLPENIRMPSGSWTGIGGGWYGVDWTPENIELGPTGTISVRDVADRRGVVATRTYIEEIKVMTLEGILTRLPPNSWYERMLIDNDDGVDKYYIKTDGSNTIIPKEQISLGKTGYGTEVIAIKKGEINQLQGKLFTLLHREGGRDDLTFYVEVADAPTTFPPGYPHEARPTSRSRPARAAEPPKFPITSNVKEDQTEEIKRRSLPDIDYNPADLSDVFS